MRAVRPVLAMTLVASLAAAGVASAVTKPKPKPVKPVCNLITDGSGDAYMSGFGAGPSDDSLDILSGDIASNSKTLTGVLRLKNLSGGTLSSLTGQTYYVQFTVKSFQNPIYVAYQVDPSGALFQYGDVEPLQGNENYTPKGKATGVVDTAKNEIRISVALSDLASLANVKPGTKVSDVQGLTFQNIGVPNAAGGGGALQGGDTAAAAKPYIAGTPSCVKPGA